MNTNNNNTNMRAALETCLRALNSAQGFTFHAGTNPLGLKTDSRGEASSYNLAARIASILVAKAE